MVKGYQFKCDYGDGCGMKEYKSHEYLGADYVLATDYAALEAERDEWKRRCEAIVKMLDDCGTQMTKFEKYGGAQSKFAHGVYEHACLIAEGRDNG